MPLCVRIEADVVLSDLWCSKQDWCDGGEPMVLAVLAEDPYTLIEEAGGVGAIIKRVEWVDAPER